MRKLDKLGKKVVDIKTLLIERAARTENISVGEVMELTRKKEAVSARAMVMYIGMERYKLTSRKVGDWFGLDSSTARHHAYKIRNWMRYPEVALKVSRVDVKSRDEVVNINFSDYIIARAVIRKVENSTSKIFHLQQRLSETNDEKTRRLLFNEYRRKWKNSGTSCAPSQRQR
jgi:hypothetical protein